MLFLAIPGSGKASFPRMAPTSLGSEPDIDTRNGKLSDPRIGMLMSGKGEMQR